MITVIGNLKGGSGKSTVTFNLAVWLASCGVDVTAFDLDPQRTLSDVAELRNEEGYSPQFTLRHGGDDLINSLTAESGEVVVDVGVSNMESTKTALSVADRVVVPVPPSQADIWSTQRFLGILDDSLQDKRPDICVFVNRADTHHSVRESDETEEALAQLHGVTLLNQRLYQRTAYRRSFSEGLGVFELDPRNKAAKEFLSFAKVLYPKLKKSRT